MSERHRRGTERRPAGPKPPSIRRRRVADEIRGALATMLNSRLADPRLSDVCITDAEVSPDLRLATIYFRIYPTATIADDVAHAALEHARPVFRRELGQQLRLRSVPDLRFRLDTTADHAAHIDQLLSEIQAERRAEEMEDSTGDDAGDDDASLEEE